LIKNKKMNKLLNKVNFMKNSINAHFIPKPIKQ
jgi:hypothetical protein